MPGKRARIARGPGAAQVAGPIDQVHLVSRNLEEAVFVPPHAPRKATPQYRAMHKKLVVDEDRSCLVCGVKNSILNDSRARLDRQKNPAGATRMETHHRIIEWSLMNAIDVKRFNARIIAGLRRHHFQELRWKKDFTEAEMKAFIDHDEENIWVLCDVHHRHGYVGIHAISDPIWGPQDLLKDGYQYTPYKPGQSPKRTGARKPKVLISAGSSR